WMSGGTPNGSPQSTTVGATGQVESIPLRGTTGSSRGDGIFQTSPRESKIGFETRTPTPFGEARTVMEFDWAGSTAYAPGAAAPTGVSDSLVPRLRYAYGTLGGFLAGQATSNFADPDANGETLDFGGNVGEPGHVRIPQVRYTMPAWWGTSLSFSAETPETQIATGAGYFASDAGFIGNGGVQSNCNVTTGSTAQTCSTTVSTSGGTFLGTSALNAAKATAPNFTTALYIPQQWGHVDFSGVLLPGIDMTDGKYIDKQFIGYGGHIGVDVKPGWMGWVKDDIIAHFVVGDGIGSYLNASNNFQLVSNFGAAGAYGSYNGPTTAAAAALIKASTVQELGGEIGYQHWWLANLRSNINAGVSAQNGIKAAFVPGQTGSYNKELITAHANLIWNPVSSIDIGLEYMWGQRTVVSNLTATENVLISKMAFRF
ncbi:MAG: DcaP family trimeric outer membrane transporter, partial [Stellaceae bacterium]